jgi:hypothetical protein
MVHAAEAVRPPGALADRYIGVPWRSLRFVLPCMRSPWGAPILACAASPVWVLSQRFLSSGVRHQMASGKKKRFWRRFGRFRHFSNVVPAVLVLSSFCRPVLPPPQTVAREYSGRGITANAVAPGFIASDMTAAIDPKYEEGILKTIPIGERRTVPLSVCLLV